MRKVIFFAYTPFQAIASMAIKDQYYNSDLADIILSDSIQNREEMKNNIEAHKLFNKVYFGNIRTYFPKSNNKIKHEVNRVKASFFPYYIARDLRIKECYDVFVTTEVNYYTESIYAFLRKINPNIQVELMDEGYSSYTYYFKEAYKPSSRKNIIKYWMFHIPGYLYGRKFISKEAKVIYYFAPELLCWQEIPYQIRKIDINKSRQFYKEMNQLFNYEFLYNNDLKKEFDKPYLYFEESFFWSMGNANDEKIIDHIAEIIGKDNLAIKLHPRNEIDRFTGKGYKTNKRYGIPWEVVAANLPDDDRRVFISFSSGAVLNYKFICNKSFKTILLYKCIGDQYYCVDDSVKVWFEKFRDNYGESVYIPETLEELDRLLCALKK